MLGGGRAERPLPWRWQDSLEAAPDRTWLDVHHCGYLFGHGRAPIATEASSVPGGHPGGVSAYRSPIGARPRASIAADTDPHVIATPGKKGHHQFPLAM